MSNELATVNDAQLPANLEDLSKFALIGRDKLQAVRAEIAAIKKVGLASEVLEQKRAEAQEIAELVTLSEMRMGEMLKEIPKASGGDRRSENFKVRTDANYEKPKSDVLTELGITKDTASRFEQMADHPEIVQQAIAEARENDDIVSRAAVLKKIKAAKEEEKKEQRRAAIDEAVEQPRSGAYVDIETTDKKYRVIYADPPWSYNDKQNTSKLGGAAKHYDTMPLEDICALSIPAQNNSVLFMWATSPLLEDAFKVINAWGFKYKTSFVWDKVLHAMGHYNSVRHELLLIATRGSCTPDIAKLYDSVVSIERTEHSRKPAWFREMIDELYPVGERIELFAREAPKGWDVWGNMA